MSLELTTFQFETVRHVAADRIGMAVSDRNRGVVTIRVSRAAASLGMPVSRFCLMLAHDETCTNALIRELTVHETYFMREKHQLYFASHWLAERFRNKESETLHVLSSGCASGEEVYSLRMAMMETTPEICDPVQILGIDISNDMIERAQTAKYQPHALRMLSAPQINHFFIRISEDAYMTQESVREHTRFQTGNLLTLHLPADSCDMILCRNLLMYLTEDARTTAVNRFVHWLKPGGCLILGTTEALRTGEPRLKKYKEDGVFYYIRKE